MCVIRNKICFYLLLSMAMSYSTTIVVSERENSRVMCSNFGSLRNGFRSAGKLFLLVISKCE